VLFHTHHLGDAFGEIKNELSQTSGECISLLTVTEYIATECENEDIVIEESLRESMYNYIDVIAPDLFTSIFNFLSERILNEELQTWGSKEEIQKVKLGILKSVTNWLKMKLPEQFISELHTQNQSIFNLIFKELD